MKQLGDLSFDSRVQDLINFAYRATRENYTQALDFIKEVEQSTSANLISNALLTTNEESCNLLHLACSKGDTATVQRLLAKLSDDDARKAIVALNKDKENPLHAACENGDIFMIEALLARLDDATARIAIMSPGQRNALFYACERDIAIVNTILARLDSNTAQAAIVEYDDYFGNPLLVACKSSNTALVKLLLAKLDDHAAQTAILAQPSINDDDTYTSSLIVACERGDLEMVNALLARLDDNAVGLANSAQNYCCASALTYAVMHNSEGKVNALLARLDDNTAQKTMVAEDGEMASPLKLACNNVHNDMTILNILLAKLNNNLQIAVLEQGGHIGNLLHYACLCCTSAVVNRLLMILDDDAARSAILSLNTNGWSPLHVACRFGDVVMLNLLFNKLNSPNAQETFLNTRINQYRDGNTLWEAYPFMLTPLQLATLNKAHGVEILNSFYSQFPLLCAQLQCQPEPQDSCFLSLAGQIEQKKQASLLAQSHNNNYNSTTTATTATALPTLSAFTPTVASASSLPTSSAASHTVAPTTTANTSNLVRLSIVQPASATQQNRAPKRPAELIVIDSDSNDTADIARAAKNAKTN